MELKPIEVDMLIGIYQMNLNNRGTISMEDYVLEEDDDFEQKQEFYSYLNELKKLHYIEFENKDFIFGGQVSKKYGTNVQIINNNRIKITKKGINYMVPLN